MHHNERELAASATWLFRGSTTARATTPCSQVDRAAATALSGRLAHLDAARLRIPRRSVDETSQVSSDLVLDVEFSALDLVVDELGRGRERLGQTITKTA